MTKTERNKRINQSIVETKRLLAKAKKRLMNTKLVLKQIKGEVQDNVAKSDKKAWRVHLKEDSLRVKELESFIKKLQNMKK